MSDLGAVPASSTIVLFFTTHAQTGAAVAPLTAYEVADVVLYKGNSATQRSSTSGWTMTSPFDAITGLHVLNIDLSDNTDAGFYAAGSFYNAVLSADTETVDGLAVVRVIGTFRIVVAENTAGTPVMDAGRWNNLATVALPLIPTVAGRSLDVSAAGEAGLDWANIGGPTTAQNLSGTSTKAVEPTVAGRTLDVAATGEAGVDFSNINGTLDAAETTGLATSAVLGALADAAADGVPTATDTVMAYIKQLVNDLEGTAGIVTWPAGVAPGNAVSIAEGLRWLTDQVGTAGAALTAADDAVIAAVATVQADTDDIQTRLPAALVGGRMDSSVGAMAAAVVTAAAIAADAIGASELAADAVTEIAAGVVAVALTESYAADTVAPTLSQAIFQIMQFLHEATVAGTTVTVKKLDGATTAMTLTINDATNPTSISRTT